MSTILPPVREHALMLAGYMDAVGRLVSTDSLLYTLTIRELESGLEPSEVLAVPAERGEKVLNWSREFQDIVENVLGLNGRDRLSCYLMDYIDWFEEFYGATGCFRLNCGAVRPEVETQRIHLIERAEEWAYLSIITVSKKPPEPVFNTPGPLDPRV